MTTDSPADTRSTAATADEPGDRASAALARGPFGYLPGLDGLRAVSVVAVLAYHLDLSWATGGYLGVEVFFVISGYLITLLMLDERARTGVVDRGAFWWRRARRLLPAVVTLIVVVVLWAAMVLPAGELLRFRGDAIASLLYVQNWHAIVTEQPYFAAFGRPSPLRHLWSLAIEEQFYLVWPVLLPALIARRSPRQVTRILLVLATASVVLMAQLGDIAAPDRAYYGTDTRAFGLLLGAALAFAWQPHRARDRVVPAARRTLDLAGGAALALLAWQFVHRSEFDPWTYPWGFLWVDVLTLVAIVAATHPASRLAGGVGARPMAALGRRSYSIYLWHWPVIVFTRPGIDWGLTGWRGLLARLILVAALSEASYRFVEQPFRDGRVAAWVRRARSGTAPAALPAAATAGLVVVALFAGALSAAGDVGDQRPVRAAGGPAVTIPIEPPPTEATTTTATTAAPTTVPATAPAAAPAPTTVPAPPPPTAPRPVPDVTVIGESVTVGAADRLREHYGQRMQIDARESRSFEDGIVLIEALAEAGRLTPYVVVHMGNNGAVPPGGMERIVRAVGPDKTLVLLTVHVPRQWEAQVNGEVARTARDVPNARLVDWYGVAKSEPGLLHSDGVHLTREGEVRYTQLLAGATP